MNKLRFLPIFLLAILSFSTIGCGGGGGSTATISTRPIVPPPENGKVNVSGRLINKGIGIENAIVELTKKYEAHLSPSSKSPSISTDGLVISTTKSDKNGYYLFQHNRNL